MRNTSTFGVQFITRMNKVKDGLAPIYARITVDSKRIEISLKKWVTLADWNNVKGMSKGSRPEIKSLNRYLEEVRSRLLECYQEMHNSINVISLPRPLKIAFHIDVLPGIGECGQQHQKRPAPPRPSGFFCQLIFLSHFP